MWRIVGVRVGLPRHDVEVEGVVLKDEAVLNSVFHEYFNAGCCDMRNLLAP